MINQITTWNDIIPLLVSCIVMFTQQAAALSLLSALVDSFKLSLRQQHRQTANSRQLAAGWSYTCETLSREQAPKECGCVCVCVTDSMGLYVLFKKKAGFTSSTRTTDVQQSQLLPCCHARTLGSKKNPKEKFYWLEMSFCTSRNSIKCCYDVVTKPSSH